MANELEVFSNASSCVEEELYRDVDVFSDDDEDKIFHYNRSPPSPRKVVANTEEDEIKQIFITDASVDIKQRGRFASTNSDASVVRSRQLSSI